VTLSSAPGNLSSVGTQLRAALSNADPAPAFTGVVVLVLGSRLLILPGTGGTSIQDYLAITLQSELPFQFSATSAVLLGNVALASHGEKVTDEVLGDGDAAVAFLKFELQKKAAHLYTQRETWRNRVDPSGAGQQCPVDRGAEPFRQRSGGPSLHNPDCR